MNDLTVQAGTVIAERTYGPHAITVSLSTAADGFTINIRTGAIRHGDLAKGFTTIDDALTYGAQIRGYALNGMTIAHIFAKLGLTKASYERHTEPTEDTKPAARIADIYGVRRAQVRPTMAGAHLTPLSAPQQAALNTAVNGQVSLQPGISRPTLRALVRKGYGEAIYQAGLGRRQVIEAVRLFTTSTAVAA